MAALTYVRVAIVICHRPTSINCPSLKFTTLRYPAFFKASSAATNSNDVLRRNIILKNINYCVLNNTFKRLIILLFLI